VLLEMWVFGEGGIRTPHDRLDSVSCRFYIAANAVNANDAVAPCTRLHPQNLSSGNGYAARPVRDMD